MNTVRKIGYTGGAALAASLAILGLALLVFGPHPSIWPKWQGRLLGVTGTLAGIAAATWGFRRARAHDAGPH